MLETAKTCLASSLFVELNHKISDFICRYVKLKAITKRSFLRKLVELTVSNLQCV